MGQAPPQLCLCSEAFLRIRRNKLENAVWGSEVPVLHLVVSLGSEHCRESDL